MYPNARLFSTPTNKWLSRSLFCANKNFCPNFVCVCFVCAVCVLLQFRVIKYCARKISKVVLSVLRRKKTFLICLQEKNLASVLDFTQNNHNFTGFPGKTSISFPEILAGILNFPIFPVRSRPVNPGKTGGNLKFPDFPGKIPAKKSRKNWRES